jgi:DNA-binding response OmpR family regulator
VGSSLRPLQAGAIKLDPASMQVTVAGHSVLLTAYEFALLKAFVERAGRVLSREYLLDHARGNSEEAFERSIDIHISKLRQKLGDDARQPRYLKTIRGLGYMLSVDKDP